MPNNNQSSVLHDNEIIELYWNRDENAIKETDKKYKNYLLTVAHNILHDEPDCEECLNDTYSGAWNAIPPARPAVLKAFLTTIMRRIAVNRYHVKNARKRVPSNLTESLSDFDSMLSGTDEVESDYDAKVLGEVIGDFVRGLSERRQYIFIARYYVAMPIDVICSLLSVSKATVNREIAEIKQELKNKLESEGYEL